VIGELVEPSRRRCQLQVQDSYFYSLLRNGDSIINIGAFSGPDLFNLL
jgi:hypothetical protein